MSESVPPGGLSPAIAWWLAMPAIVATVLLALVAVAETMGRSPLSEGRPRNLAEAAGLARASEVLRLVEDGEDPARVETVRPFLISPSMTRVTALEAAVWTRRVELVTMLDRLGAIRSPDGRHHLACLAADLDVRDIVQYLAPDGAACSAGATIRAIGARSR